MSHEERLEMLCAIIESFEELLDDRGIVIPNKDKDDAIASGEDPESICNIYGCDYGNLEQKIEQILINYKLIEEEN